MGAENSQPQANMLEGDVDEEAVQISEPGFKLLARSVHQVFSDMGGWSMGDLTFGMRAVSKAMAKEVDEWENMLDRFPVVTSAQVHDELLLWSRICFASYEKTPEAFIKVAEIGDIDMVQSGWKSKFNRPAFMLFAHDAPDAVILVIRGTDSLDDALTDVCNVSERFQSGNVHYGAMQSAQWLWTTVKSQLIALLKQHSSKHLIIAGHSLGGAIAICFGLLTRKRFPTSRVIAIEPAAAVDQTLSDGCASYVTSLVHRNDVVPRLSTGHLVRLRADIIEYPWQDELVASNKFVGLLASTASHVSLKTKKGRAKIGETYVSAKQKATVAATSAKAKVKVPERFQRSRAGSAGSAGSTGEEDGKQKKKGKEPVPDPWTKGDKNVMLVPAGRVYYLAKEKRGIVLTEQKPSFFDSLILHKSMISDHMLPAVMASLNESKSICCGDSANAGA